MISSAGGARAGIIFDATDNTGPAFTSLQARLAAAKTKVNDLGSTAAALPARFGTIGVALGAAFAGASLKGAIDMGDQLDDLSEKTGIAVKDLSALRYAGEVTGTPLEALATGVKKLSNTMYEAAGGGKEQAAIFKALGIELRTASGALRGSDEVLGDVADAFAGFNDGPEKAALAVKIFGKAGADMIPLLNQGSAGIRDLREEAQQLGATIGEDAARNFATFNDNLRKLQLYSEGAKTTLASELVPTLNTLAEAFLQTREGGAGFADFLGGTLRTGLEALSIVGANVAFVLKGVGRELAAWAAQAVALARLDINGFNAISDAVKEDGVRARAELDALEQRILNVGKSLAGAGRGALPDPRALGPVGTIREQARELRKNAPIVESSTAAAKDTTYGRLNKSLQERLALMGQEIAAGRELSDVEKLEAKTLADLALAKGKVTDAQRATILAELEGIKGMQLAMDIQRSQLAQAKQIAADRQKLRNAEDESVGAWLREQKAQADASLAAINERARAIEDEIRAADLAATANVSLAEAVELVAIARARERQERTIAGSPAWVEIEREIEARERLLQTMGRQRVTQDMARDWAKLVDDIYSGLTDSLFRAFESGGKFFSTFWSGIKNTIKTTVLRLAIQAVVGTKDGGGLLGTLLQAGSNPANAGSVGAGIGNIGSLASIASGISSFSGYAATGFMNTVAGGAGLIGNLGTGISAATSLISGGSVASGLGMLAGTLGPIIAVIALVAQLAKSFKGETRSGGQYNFGTLVSGPSGGEIGGSGVAAKAAKITADSIDAILAKVGSQARLTNFFSGLETSDKGKGFVGAGGTLTTGQAFGEGWGAAFRQDLYNNRRGNFTSDEAFAAFQEELMQATLQALQAATDVPKAIQQELAGKDFNGMVKTELEAQLGVINQLIGDVDKFRAAAQQLPFERLAGLSFDLAAALGKAAGGMDNLLSGMQAFYSADYFSEAELRQQTARNIQRVLAAAGGTFSVADILRAADQGETGRQLWRAVVTAFEEQVAQGDEAAAPLLAALYSVTGAFTSITPIIEEVAQTVGDSLDQLAQEQADYKRNLASAGSGIADLIRDLTVNKAGLATPGDRLNAARAQYLGDLAGARAGSVEASQRVSDSAKAYIDAQLAYTASGPASNATVAQVLAELQALPAFKSYEQQLLEEAQRQATLLEGIKVNTAATVSAVMSGFTGLAGYVPGTVGTGTPPTGGAAWGGSPTTVGQALATPPGMSTIGGASFGGTATNTVAPSISQVLGSLDWADPALATANLAQAMRQFDWTAGDVSGIYTWFSPQQIADHLKAAGFADVVPGYAAGGLHPGGLRIVGERGPELEATGPAMYWSADRTRDMVGGDNAEVVAELRGVRQQLSALEQQTAEQAEELRILRAVTAAYAQRDLATGEKIAGNTAASSKAAELAAAKPTPAARGGKP